MLYRLVALAAIIATGAGAPVQDHGLDSRLHALEAKIHALEAEKVEAQSVTLTKDMQKCLETRESSVNAPVDRVEKKLGDKVLALFVEKTGQRPGRARYEDLLSKGIDVLASKCVELIGLPDREEEEPEEEKPEERRPEEPRKRRPRKRRP